MRSQLKIAVAVFCALLLSGAPLSVLQPRMAQAVPAKPGLRTFRQPDGTSFQGRVLGDEVFHWVQTAAGNPILQDQTTHVWKYALPSATGVTNLSTAIVGRNPAPVAAWKPVRPAVSGRNTTRSLTTRAVSTSGTGRIPVLLAEFSDSTTLNYSRTDFQSQLFGTGNDSSGQPLKTMSNFYQQQSRGQFHVTGSVANWVRVPNTHDYYGANTDPNTAASDAHPDQLVRETVQAEDATFDFGPYDTDNDGYVDMVCVVHDGTDEAASPNTSDIWSHAANLSDYSGWGAGPVTTNDKNAAGNYVKINKYFVTSELGTDSSGATKPRQTIGVFCHEYGHILGLPDLYDVDYTSEGVGNYSLMAFGANLGASVGGGDCPSNMDAWSRYQLGWLTPTAFTFNEKGSQIPTSSIPTAANNYALFLGSNGTTGGSQYFLVENRQQKGFDAFLPSAGLAIWHIDDAMTGNNLDNSREWYPGYTSNGHFRVALEQSDGAYNLEVGGSSAPGNGENVGDAGDLYGYTQPGNGNNRNFDTDTAPSSKTYSGTATNVAVRNISDSADTMTADIYVHSDHTVPTISISTPAAATKYTTLPSASGVAGDNGTLQEKRFSLYSETLGKWRNWLGGSFDSATFDADIHFYKQTNSSTSWQFTMPSLADGNYQLQASAVDVSGNISDVAVTHFTIQADQSPPNVTITNPANNAESTIYTNSTYVTPVVTGTATDPAGGNSGVVEVGVAFYDATHGKWWNWTAQAWGTATFNSATNRKIATGTTNWSIQLPGIVNGSYQVSANAVDSSGNASAYKQISFSVVNDNTPPTASIAVPAVDSTVSSVSLIGGLCSDLGSGIDRVVLFIIRDKDGYLWNGSAWVSNANNGLDANLPTTVSGGSWGNAGSLPANGNANPATSWGAGSYSIQAKAYDKSGNTAFGYGHFTFEPTYTFIGKAATCTLADCTNYNYGDAHAWGDIRNWSPTGVPAAGDIAAIDGFDVTSTVSRTVKGIRMASGSLDFTNTGGTLTLTGGSAWTGGTLYDTIQVSAGATLAVSGTSAKVLGGNTVLNNSGTVTWTGTGTVYGSGYYGAPTINNQNGGTWNLLADGLPFGHDNNVPAFNNAAGAKMIKSGGTGTTTLTDCIFNNAGEFRANTGTLAYNGTLNSLTGATYTGAGIHSMPDGAFNINGNSAITGTTFTLSGGTITGNGGALSTTSGTFGWTGGTLGGTFTLSSGAVMNISGASTKVFASNTVLNNLGRINWSGTGAIHGSGYYGPPAINNKSGAVFYAESDASFTHDNSTASFNNNAGAVFSKTGGTGVTGVDWVFNNNGTATVPTGTLNLTAGGASSGIYTATSPAILTFTGGTHTLSGAARLSGTGEIRVDGATVTATGTSSATMTGTGLFKIISGQLNGSATGTFGGTGLFSWTGGTIGGTFNLAALSRLNITGISTKVLASNTVFNNFGAVNWSSGNGANNASVGQVYNSGYYGAAAINNKSGGTWTLLTDGQPFGHDNNQGAFNNEAGAKFIKAAATTGSAPRGDVITLTDVTFNNNGELQSNSGAILVATQLNLNTGSILRGAGKYRFNNTVTANAPFNSASEINLEGGDFIATPGTNGAPIVTYSGAGLWKWTAGTISGNLSLASGTTMSLSGVNNKVLASNTILNNNGTISWTGAYDAQNKSIGQIYASGYYGPAIVNNQSGGVFNITTDGQPFAHDNAASIFNNAAGAQFVKTGGTGVTAITDWILSNAGEIRANSGQLQYQSTLNLSDGGKVTGPGSHAMTAGTTNQKGTTTVSGTSFTIQDGTFNSDTTLPAKLASASNGLWNWTGGTLTGATTVNAGVTLGIQGPATKNLSSGAALNNLGIVNWNGTGTIYTDGYYGGSAINNKSGGVFNLLSNGNVFSHTNNLSAFNNESGGTLVKIAGAGATNLSDFIVNNSGNIDANVGQLTYNTALNMRERQRLPGRWRSYRAERHGKRQRRDNRGARAVPYRWWQRHWRCHHCRYAEIFQWRRMDVDRR